MIRSLPNTRSYTLGFKLYVALFFVFLFAPLFITCVLAFNDSQFPALPWKGFTWNGLRRICPIGWASSTIRSIFPLSG
jgi:ABC-type spermidine/putrescine transport system permease subunit II